MADGGARRVRARQLARRRAAGAGPQSEAQAGRRLVRKVPVDLADGVTAALSAVRREVGRLGLDITTDLRPAPVVGDPSLLERLAGNLIENAVRYNHGQGRIWVRTETDGATRWLVVGNTGFEVDAGDVPELFEAFRRGVRDRTGSGRGAGLGLSIVRAVTDAHGGSVRAEPIEGGGLEVIVTLPAAVGDARGDRLGRGADHATVGSLTDPPHGGAASGSGVNSAAG